MKIGIDIRLIGKKRTGDETVIFNLVKNLGQIDRKNSYLLFTDTSDEKTISEIAKNLKIENKDNLKIISLPVNRFFWNFWSLPKYLRKNPVDVYHTQYITPWFVPKSIKIVTIIHDISFNFFPQFIKFSDLFFLKTLIPISLRRADKIIAVSEFTKNEIVKFYKISPKKVECVYNSVDEEFLDKVVSEEKLEEVKVKYNLPEKFILYIGTLQPRKNIPQLIEAFARIKNRPGDLKLVICGNKSTYNYDKEIDNTIKKNDIGKGVIFTGFIDEEDKKAVYKLARVFVSPSFYEGFGIPILEAMALGIPVIVSKIPAHQEIAEESALFFEINNKDDLKEKIENIYLDESLGKELILKGKQRLEKFSWHKSALKMLDIYNRFK